MFSMTATAPESIQQRRRLSQQQTSSPRVTPTKSQRSSPVVVPYGQHSPFPLQEKSTAAAAAVTRGGQQQHRRRYSAGTDATTILMNNVSHHTIKGVGVVVPELLPPMMPLDCSNTSCGRGEKRIILMQEEDNVVVEQKGSIISPRDIFRDVVSGEHAHETDSNSHDAYNEISIEQKCSSLSIEDGNNKHVVSTNTATTINNLDGKNILKPSPPPPLFFTDNGGGEGSDDNDDDYDEGNEYFDRCKEENATKSYQRSTSMEPLFDHPSMEDEEDHHTRPNKRNFLALKTVYSIDDNVDTNIMNHANENNELEQQRPEIVPMSPGYEDHHTNISSSSPIYSIIVREGDTCSSTNGVYMENENDCEEEMIMDGNNIQKSFQRSTSMQPILDQDLSSERLLSAEPLMFEEGPENTTTNNNNNARKIENVNGNNNNKHNPIMSPVEEIISSPLSTTDESRKTLPNTTTTNTNPSSPIVYTLSDQPSSPLLSDIQTEVNTSSYNYPPSDQDVFGRVCAQLTGVSLSHDSASDTIGGDAYFDRECEVGEEDHLCLDGTSYHDDADHNDDYATTTVSKQSEHEDELMQPIALPPRLKRTTTDPDLEEPTAALNFPLSPNNINNFKRPGQHHHSIGHTRNFDHTHSLLDDCSEDEDEIQSFHMVDSPTRHTQSYSCFPKKHTNHRNSPYVSYLNFKKQKPNKYQEQQIPPTTNTSVDHNIQKALLETRHRRWACQSTYAKSHAQSDQVLDVSHRVQHISIPENRLNWNYSRNHDLQFIEEDLDSSESCCSSSGGPVIVLSRMSISHAAIRAGALACGLWRTVKLVRLPKGLFEKHWLMWRERKHSFEEVYDENDVWALLQMLRGTFPLLDQLEFDGDTVKMMSDDTTSDDCDIRNEWRDEIVNRILQILPNLISIDGLDVTGKVLDVPCSPHEEFVPLHSAPTLEQVKAESPDVHGDSAVCVQDAKSSVACAVCEPVDVQMCGWTHLVDTQAESIKEAFSFEVTNNAAGSESVEAVEIASSFPTPEHQCSVAGDISSDAIEDVSQNILTMIEGCVGPTQEGKESYTMDYSPPTPLESEVSESHDEAADQMLTSSNLSNSWEATNHNPSRPPICPASSKHQRRVPNVEKKSKGSVLKARFKRRVLGLIPSTSVMDEDDDSDCDENENNIDECPADLL